MGQTDSLRVYLEKNKEHKCGINLVFENNYCDTILLMTAFENFSFIGEMPQNSGITIEFYDNGNSFRFNWGEGAIERFDFFDGFKLISPNSIIRLFFNICDYYYFPDDRYTLEVSFFMNYVYGKYGSQNRPNKVEYFRTNRVTLFEPPKEDAENDNPCPDAEK